MARARHRRPESVAVSAAARVADRALAKAFLLIYLGAGCATGYILFHRNALRYHWLAMVLVDLVAVVIGAAIVWDASKMTERQRARPGAMTPVKWVVAMIAAFVVSFLIGCQAK